MVKGETIPCVTTYSPGPLLPPPPLPPPPPPPPQHHQGAQAHPPTLVPATQSLPPPSTFASDPTRTTAWGPIFYTRKSSKTGHTFNKKTKKHKKNKDKKRHYEDVTLAGQETSHTWGMVDSLGHGVVRNTWTTYIEVRIEEVVKPLKGASKKGKSKKNKKTKRDKEDSSSDGSTDSDKSDSDKEDPIRELAKFSGFGGLVTGPSDP